MKKEYFKNQRKNDLIVNNLQNTWFIESPIDEEHKLYKMMAYLQRMDENIKNGFIFEEFTLLSNRIKDLNYFKATYQICDKSAESDKLFDQIYDSSTCIKDLETLMKIANNSLNILKEKYEILNTVFLFVKDKIDIEKINIKDKRKKVNFYIEKCNCSVIEHYQVSKNDKVSYIGYSNSENYTFDDNENYINIKTKSAIESETVVIPYLLCLFELEK